jgi:signal transduction histidine kinase
LGAFPQVPSNHLQAVTGAGGVRLLPPGRHRIGIARVCARTLLNIANDILDLTRIDGTVLARRLHTLLASAGMVGAGQVERVAACSRTGVKANRRAELGVGRTLLAESVHWFEQELESRLDGRAGTRRSARPQ